MKQPDLYYYEAIKIHYKVSQILYGENELQASPGGGHSIEWPAGGSSQGKIDPFFFSVANTSNGSKIYPQAPNGSKWKESDVYSDQLNDSEASLHCKVLMVMFYRLRYQNWTKFSCVLPHLVAKSPQNLPLLVVTKFTPKLLDLPLGHSIEWPPGRPVFYLEFD